ncbi:hypothetical protein VTL71DRAFT_920 [Oculimacula yallundae]|uniref:tRNA(Phe) 7-[(3-amino-3-carboxypropyl)-4-demethylwyosine(37)-N(4)]-methyltransferase n=1 Tax=Oculimacula yallundae TaxID=86028 RepID=A0ABR4D2C7_9HELO
MANQPSPPSSFLLKKSRILQALSVPISEYDDLSPKGSIDVGIRELIDEINALEGCVTTSSCAGRISVFLEGRRKSADEGSAVEKGEAVDGNRTGDEKGDEREEDGTERTAAGVGGKGGGGRWLFVSHDPVAVGSGSELGNESQGGMDSKSCAGMYSWTELLGMQRLEGGDENVRTLMESAVGERRLVHFKFEPMILHILTASLPQAQTVLLAALQAGFRESGALNLTTSSSSTSEPPTPMVGIRSMGLALESVIGFESQGREICMVPEWQLKHLIEVSNQRFVENAKRIERFRTLLREGSIGLGKEKKGDAGEWEDAGARRERKRAEGMKRAEELRRRKDTDGKGDHAENLSDIHSLDQEP